MDVHRVDPTPYSGAANPLAKLIECLILVQIPLSSVSYVEHSMQET